MTLHTWAIFGPIFGVLIGLCIGSESQRILIRKGMEEAANLKWTVDQFLRYWFYDEEARDERE